MPETAPFGCAGPSMILRASACPRGNASPSYSYTSRDLPATQSQIPPPPEAAARYRMQNPEGDLQTPDHIFPSTEAHEELEAVSPVRFFRKAGRTHLRRSERSLQRKKALSGLSDQRQADKHHPHRARICHLQASGDSGRT